MNDYLRRMSADEISVHVGREMGVSEWFHLTQERIDAFAHLTEDRNFVHIDPERAMATPFGGTIAHGFLTLSILPWMAYQVCPRVNDAQVNINYGFNRVRFLSPVPANSRIRGRFVLRSFERLSRRWQSTYDVAVEIENATKPAIAAEWITASMS